MFVFGIRLSLIESLVKSYCLQKLLCLLKTDKADSREVWSFLVYGLKRKRYNLLVRSPQIDYHIGKPLWQIIVSSHWISQNRIIHCRNWLKKEFSELKSNMVYRNSSGVLFLVLSLFMFLRPILFSLWTIGTRKIGWIKFRQWFAENWPLVH